MIARSLVNFAGFQAVWLLSLLGAGSNRPWLGAAVLAVFALWHFRTTSTPAADLVLVALTGVVGFIVDTGFIQAHLLAYAAPLPFPEVAPYWIMGMWVNFALTLNGSMRWLQGHYLAAALLGAVGGPLAYLAGIQMGAAELLADKAVVITALAIVWSLAVPLLVLTTSRVNRAWPAPLSSPGTGRG